MAGLGRAARRAALAGIARWVGGGRLDGAEAAAAERDLDLLGFRKAAFGLLLRRRARAALEARSGMTILASCLDDRFVCACAGDDTAVGWEILAHGTYEPHVVAFYAHTLEAGMTVLDVGANIGFHALHAASLVGPEGRVIAVEPDARNAALLRLAMERNPELRIELLEAALSDREGPVVLSDLGNPANSGARFVHEDRAVLERLVHGPAPTYRAVEAFPWDARHLDRPLHLVKMDVEGFEPRVARGMERALARHRPIVLSEYAPSNLAQLGGTTAADYLRWFEQRGYSCSILDEADAARVAASPSALAERLRGRHHIDVVFDPK